MQNEEKTKENQKEIRSDGYKNLLNKYGTKNDASEHYAFESDGNVSDVDLEINYEENGLFAKIIDIPADDAVRGGCNYNISDVDITTFIDKSLDELDFKAKAAEALKWARLFGGSIMVMFIDDGGELDDPVDWDNIQGIDELQVFELPFVTPDYNSIYRTSGIKNGRSGRSKCGMPEYYNISPIYGGTFRVHESRCLIFRNNKIPMYSSYQQYRYFGIPEYMRIHRDLQVTTTSHGNGAKLLDRAVQAVYKMQGLAERILTEDGEEEILKRLNLIDMAKGILNSIAIDADGEDYHYETVTFSGVKDIVDAACNMLSAVTGIPQTKLFGRSPAGENSTGEGDMENYYGFIGNIQELNLKKNIKTVIDIILSVGKYKKKFDEIPDYNLEFKPLWNMDEKQQADTDKVKADTEFVKAQTAQIYVDMQAIDAEEVRKRLSEDGEFTVNDIISEEGWNDTETGESEETVDTALPALQKIPDVGNQETENTDSDMQQPAFPAQQIIPTGCGVIVMRDGKVLVGNRKDSGLICGPGGHIEAGESPEEAAIRETREEFGINIAETIPVALIAGMPEGYCPSQVFLCTEFYGEPISFNDEMENARFAEIGEVLERELFLPFRLGLEEMMRQLHECMLTESSASSNIKAEADGGPGSGRKPEGGGDDDEPPKDSSGKSYKRKAAKNVSVKEAEKVGHDINNIYHAKYNGKRSGMITTYNPDDDIAYNYAFECHGFGEYNIFSKVENVD